MASALQLTAQNTILNGQGLAVNPNVLSQISTLRSQQPYYYIANVFSTLSSANATYGNTASLGNILTSIGYGVTQGQWLLDLYPTTVTPVSSGGVTYYGSGNLFIFGNVNNSKMASFTRTITTQVDMPFSYGVQGFANVFQTSYGYINSTFDTVSSVYLLQNKTYSQSGIGYTGPSDLATYGVNNNGSIIAAAVENFGTMYDVTNLSKIGDVYVFGQNLLNQGFGTYGGLSSKLTAAGLNINNLSQIPSSSSVTTTQTATSTVSTPIGSVGLPTLTNVTTEIVITGNSPDVVIDIYSTITGSDLDAIIAGTGIVLPASASINSLADFLTLSNVVDTATYNELGTLSIQTLSDLGSYLQAKIGGGYAPTWASVANFFSNIVSPTLSTTSTSNPNATVISSSLASSLLSKYGTGSGPFNNMILLDLLGATEGSKYIPLLAILNNNYSSLSSSINLTSLMQTLDTEVTQYVAFNGNLGNAAIISTVSAINAGLNSLTGTLAQESQTAYNEIITGIQNEYNNLIKAGVVFNSSYPAVLNSFASSFTTLATDQVKFNTYQFFGNLITNDANGDTLKLALAEDLNISALSTVGIASKNDPNPASIIASAAQQNTPINTYITQNQ